MENYYAQVALASTSGETADVAINTFAVTHQGTLTGSDVDAWQAAILDFYDDIKVAGGLYGRAKTGHESKFLKATMAKPNYPLYNRSWSLTSASNPLELPNEVALCVSYASDGFPLVPRARRRGRIYISGWQSTKNSAGRPTSSTRTALATAYQTYAVAILAITDMAPGVWSRSTGDVFPIDRTWCDDEWDTMRSRGGKSTVRTTLPIF
uniref:Uncharacterized protein n=1 Tax=uncultured prokaryote TaxID=198431 RepID=A0A0H5Q6Y2_9ZZZZ|nr:hypothetical protein [uncultured prokaryote]